MDKPFSPWKIKVANCGGGHGECSRCGSRNKLKQVLCYWVDILSQTKVRVQKPKKIQYGHQAAILKVTSLKMYRLLSMATINMHIEFGIEIPQQTWRLLQKPCRLRTDGRTDRQTDRRIRWFQYTPNPPNFVGRGFYWISMDYGMDE